MQTANPQDMRASRTLAVRRCDASGFSRNGRECCSGLEYRGRPKIHVPGKKGLEDRKDLSRRMKGYFFHTALFFDIFDFHWLDGNAVGLERPEYRRACGKALANYPFSGNWKNAVGKTIQNMVASASPCV